MAIIYSLKKDLFQPQTCTSRIIVRHKDYFIEFCKNKSFINYRFILPADTTTTDARHSTSKCYLANIIFQDSLQIVIKVCKPRKIVYGIRYLQKSYIAEYITEKMKHHISSIKQLFHPKKYYVCFTEDEITPIMKSNLSTCK